MTRLGQFSSQLSCLLFTSDTTFTGVVWRTPVILSFLWLVMAGPPIRLCDLSTDCYPHPFRICRMRNGDIDTTSISGAPLIATQPNCCHLPAVLLHVSGGHCPTRHYDTFASLEITDYMGEDKNVAR